LYKIGAFLLIDYWQKKNIMRFLSSLMIGCVSERTHQIFNAPSSFPPSTQTSIQKASGGEGFQARASKISIALVNTSALAFAFFYYLVTRVRIKFSGFGFPLQVSVSTYARLGFPPLSSVPKVYRFRTIYHFG
jgi:hypothetical protein